MKIATLYRKDGKVILETDNDAISQVATDSPQDVVVMDARLVGRPPALAAPYGQDVLPQGIAALRQIATERRKLYAAQQPAPAIDLEQFREAVVAWSDAAYTHSEDSDHPVCREADRLLALIDGSKDCRTCSGHGMIGGLRPDGQGYDAEDCPGCNAPCEVQP